MKYGLVGSEPIVDEAQSHYGHDHCAGSNSLVFPENNWNVLALHSDSSLSSLIFNNSHMISYFVARSVSDGKPAGDVKSVNKSAEYLFTCGHVQSINFNIHVI